MKSKSIFNNKFVMILLSLVLSFILWLYVITVVSPGSEVTIYNIPVELYGQSVLENDNNLLLAQDYHFTVDLRLAGNRTDLNQLNNSNIKLSVDLTNIMEPEANKPLSIKVDSFGDVPLSAITVLKKSVDSVNVTVVQRMEKELTITPVFGQTKTPDNFDKGTITFDYPQITAYGPADLMEKVTQAVVSIDLTGHTEDFKQTQVIQLLDDQNNPVVSPLIRIEEGITEVTATVPVVMYKELPLYITLREGGGALKENVDITYSYTAGGETKEIQSIGVWGPKSILDQQEYIQLDTIDLSQLKADETRQYEIVLEDGLTAAASYGMITANITLKNLETTTFHVTNIQHINKPDNMDVTMTTEVIEVVIRGPGALVEQITAEDISVIVDLSAAQAGTAQYSAQVKISELFSDMVGAVGSYSVTAIITENS